MASGGMAGCNAAAATAGGTVLRWLRLPADGSAKEVVRLAGQAHGPGNRIVVCLALDPCRTHGRNQAHRCNARREKPRQEEQNGKALALLCIVAAGLSLGNGGSVFRRFQVLLAGVQVFIEGTIIVIVLEIGNDAILNGIPACLGKT